MNKKRAFQGVVLFTLGLVFLLWLLVNLIEMISLYHTRVSGLFLSFAVILPIIGALGMGIGLLYISESTR